MIIETTMKMLTLWRLKKIFSMISKMGFTRRIRLINKNNIKLTFIYDIIFIWFRFLNQKRIQPGFCPFDFILDAFNENLKEIQIILKLTRHWKLTVTGGDVSSGTFTFSWTNLILQQIFGVFTSNPHADSLKII